MDDILYVLGIVGIGALIAAIPCGLAWWLTRKLSVWLRLLILTFIAALICTPAVVGGQGGAGFVPMACLLYDFFVSGIHSQDRNRPRPGIEEVISIAVVWMIFYGVSMAIVGIWRSVKRRMKHTSESPSNLPVHESVTSSTGSPQGPTEATPEEKPAPLVKKPKKWNYQMVLQFRGDTRKDFDAMVALEDELIAALGDSADVDGHDVGSGETNIFILTSAPASTFHHVRKVLEERQRLQEVTVAYRPVGGEDYTVIWPEGSQRKFVIA